MQSIKCVLVLFLLAFSWITKAQEGPDSVSRPTYTFEGHMETDQNQKLVFKMNLLVLLDSTLVGFYHYQPQNIALKVVGKLAADNSFRLTERDQDNSITGYFQGIMAEDKTSASGKWTSVSGRNEYSFVLSKTIKETHWDYIKKNRSLYEYTNLKQAVKAREKVEAIDVAKQGLSKLPKRIRKMPNVQTVNLLGNKFDVFPKELSALKQLNEISLSSNGLQQVGPEVGQLNNLRILILNFNKLTSLPKEIGQLENLLYLELGNNKLTTLPEEIKNLNKLEELHIERNALSEEEKIRIKALLPNCVIHF